MEFFDWCLTEIMAKKSTGDAKEELKKKSRTCSSSLFSLSIFILGLVSASYLATGTLDFGGQFKHIKAAYKRFLPESERIFTARQLAEYDGSDPAKPIYLAINGRVYDVSAGPSYYGKGGSYSFFSGKDAARAYITGCFETDLIPDLRGLTADELKGLDTWIDFYEKSDKYFYAGRVIHDPIPEDAPLPPKCRQ